MHDSEPSGAHAPLEVLLVSRPLRAERADGTVQLTRTLAASLAQRPPRTAEEPSDRPHLPTLARISVFAPWGAPPPAPGVRTRISALRSPRSDGLWPAATLAQIALAPRGVVRHYLFTPTERTVRLLRALHLVRPAPAVQTLCSAPPPKANLARLAFAHRVVALSRHSRDRLLSAGLAPNRVWWIPPAVPPLPPDPRRRRRVRDALGVPPGARLVVYLGDWDVAGAVLTVVRALPTLLAAPDRHAVLACRPKGEQHRSIAAQAQSLLAEGGAPVDRIHLRATLPDAAGLTASDLAAAADVAVLPAPRLPHKMDHPIALLESLRAGVPAVVCDQGPLSDLVAAGAALGVAPGDASSLARAVDRLLQQETIWQAASQAALHWCASGPGSPAHLASEHHRLYRSLVCQGASGRRPPVPTPSAQSKP